MKKQKRIVITGLGVCSPLGLGIKEYWKNFSGKRFPLKKIDLFSVQGFKCKYAFQINNVYFNKYFKDLKSAYIPRSAEFLLIAIKLGMDDARLGVNRYYKGEEFGIFTSSVYGSRDNLDCFYKNIIFKGPGSVGPLAFPPTLVNYASSYACIINNLQGPNLTFSSGFQGGIEGMDFASSLIKQGYIKVAIINGLNDLSLGNFTRLSVKHLLCCPQNKRAQRLSIFDNRREGFILGENASTLILEDLENARKRKARIYAEVLGYSANFGKNSVDYAQVIENAIRNSRLAPEDIDLCMLNANGIKDIDLEEIKAVRNVFKEKLTRLEVLAVKENNGECEGASAVLQVLAGAKVMHAKGMPDYASSCNKSGVFGDFKVRGKARRKRIRGILINSFNSEGNNACVIIKEMSETYG